MSRQGWCHGSQLRQKRASSRAHSKLFKPLYARLRARGLSSTAAIVILARKLARIAFSLYRSGATFDPAKHLKTA
jgi:hypothetical protein